MLKEFSAQSRTINTWNNSKSQLALQAVFLKVAGIALPASRSLAGAREGAS
jgi:hypothetical protein